MSLPEGFYATVSATICAKPDAGRSNNATGVEQAGLLAPGTIMIQRIAADLVVIVHLGFIAFVGLGALLCLRWKWVAWLHLPAVIWGAAIEFRGGVCPLTPLEQRLRVAAGDAGYAEGFIEHYLMPIIYPSGLDGFFQYTLGVLVIVMNLAIYGWVLFRHVRHASTPQA